MRGNILWLVGNLAMAAMVYYQNFDYLNAVTAFYVVLSILGFLSCFILMFLVCGADEDTDDKVMKIIINMATKSRIVGWSKSAITMLLMVMCGYVWVLSIYLIICLFSVLVHSMARDKIDEIAKDQQQ